MFYSNSSVCDKAEHCVGPSPGSEDGAGAGGGTSLELRWQLQIKYQSVLKVRCFFFATLGPAAPRCENSPLDKGNVAAPVCYQHGRLANTAEQRRESLHTLLIHITDIK